MLVASDPFFFEAQEWKGLGTPSPLPNGLRLWTDDYSNILTLLKIRP